jgi:hypothetical protein
MFGRTTMLQKYQKTHPQQKYILPEIVVQYPHLHQFRYDPAKHHKELSAYDRHFIAQTTGKGCVMWLGNASDIPPVLLDAGLFEHHHLLYKAILSLYLLHFYATEPVVIYANPRTLASHGWCIEYDAAVQVESGLEVLDFGNSTVDACGGPKVVEPSPPTLVKDTIVKEKEQPEQNNNNNNNNSTTNTAITTPIQTIESLIELLIDQLHHQKLSLFYDLVAALGRSDSPMWNYPVLLSSSRASDFFQQTNSTMDALQQLDSLIYEILVTHCCAKKNSTQSNSTSSNCAM